MNSISPIRVIGLILAVVFAIEMMIMLAIAVLPLEQRADPRLAFLDSAVLVAVLCPALWLLVVRPLRALVAQRGALLQRALLIQEEERARLARDLHDEIGQSQTAVLLGLRSILNARTLEEASERAAGVHRLALSGVESARRIARGLSPSVLHDFGLTQAIERICEDLIAGGSVEIERSLEIGAVRFDAAVEIAIYRIFQEALTNAVKHAGARRIRVELRRTDECVSVSVADDGSGVTPGPESGSGEVTGLGLAGMRERATLLGGECAITLVAGGGTTVQATVPARPLETK